MRPAGGFLVSPAYDAGFFLASPLLAVVLGELLFASPLAAREVTVLGTREPFSRFFIGAFIFAHIAIGFFRSHGNHTVFARHPLRFTLAPIALFLLLAISAWARAAAAVAAVLWDVHHSSAQTFGLARIYHRRLGNDPRQGRTLDLLLNWLLYAGPLVVGPSFVGHAAAFYSFAAVGDTSLSSLPERLREAHPALAVVALAAAALFLPFYVFRSRRAHGGHRFSSPKLLLHVSTGACSLWSFCFHPFLEAIFLMKLFHCVQYFGLVAASERRNLAALLHAAEGLPRALAVLAGTGIAFGVWAEVTESAPVRTEAALALLLTLTLLHFWYDGFVWSVRRREV